MRGTISKGGLSLAIVTSAKLSYSTFLLSSRYSLQWRECEAEMKIVIEITDTGVNVYADHAAKVDLFDCRDLQETIRDWEGTPYTDIETKLTGEYQRGLVHQTVGLFQIY